jgi:hypothetical protein
MFKVIALLKARKEDLLQVVLLEKLLLKILLAQNLVFWFFDKVNSNELFTISLRKERIIQMVRG